MFNAYPVTTSFGTVGNTLSVGDNLQDTAGDGLLNVIAVVPVFAGQPAFAPGVTMSGIKTLNYQVLGTGGALGSAGFQGNITGLTTVVDTASTGNLTLGALGQGLNTPLTSVAVNGYAGAAGSVPFAEWLAVAAGAAANSLSVTLSGVLGTTAAAGADQIQIANDGAAGTSSAPNLSYGTETYTVNSNANLQLQSNGVDGATAFVFKGTGKLAVGQDAVSNHVKVTSIDASGDSGTLWITGHAAGIATNAQGTAANPTGLFGSAAGFLDDGAAGVGFALTSFKEGTGTTNLDVSSATVAEMAALTTTANAGNTMTNNMIIVNSGVADTISAATLANIGGFQVLGDTGATGTINMANLPAAFNDIFLETVQTGALFINNAKTGLIVDLESNSGGGGAVTVGGVGPTTATTDTLTWIVGDTTQGAAGGDAAGALTSFGAEAVSILAQGATSTTGLVNIAPNPFTAVNATIGGNQSITIGFAGGLGAIEGTNVAGTALSNNLFSSLTITDTGATKFVTLVGDTTGGTLLNFATGGAPALGYSTNALTITDSGAAGLIMQAGDANFTAGATAALSNGDTITGSATNSNALAGSLGNDTIIGNTSTSTSVVDTIATNGGADTITLAAGHAGISHIDLYAVANTAAFVPGTTDYAGVASAIVNGVTATNKAQDGWWGNGTAVAGPTTIAASTSALINDQTTVANFNAGTVSTPGDQVVFSTMEWGAAVTQHGLVDGALTTLTVANAGSSVVLVNTGGLAYVAGMDLIIENTTTYGNAGAAAAALLTVGGAFTHTGETAGHFYHALVAYQDLSNNTHIMDFSWTGAGTATTATAAAGFGSDIVQLTGVPLSALIAETGANFVHFVA